MQRFQKITENMRMKNIQPQLGTAIHVTKEAEKGGAHDSLTMFCECYERSSKGLKKLWKGEGPPTIPLVKQIPYHSGSSLLAS